jgi:acyl carrier protein
MSARNPNYTFTHEMLMRTVINLVARTINDQRVRIEPDTILFSSLPFDSYALLEFVLRLETTFGLSIPDEDLDRDTFKSPHSIVMYLSGRLVP